MDLAVNGYKTYGEDNFENYILRQYGPTLYKHFFEGYSIKFLGIHPRDTHSDWAKVGINRAIIDDKAQMQNLFQLLKSTLLQFNKTPQRFLYPRTGMQEAWDTVGRKLRAAGGRIILKTGARLEGKNGQITAVYAGEERFEPSAVVWTAPITLACSQLGIPAPDLPYLGLLLYNVMVAEDAPRDYQWCYYGASDLLINRVSTPRFFSPGTAPPGTSGYCCEVTCMKGDARWDHAERLTDWVVDDLIKVGLVRSRKSVIDVRVERLPNSYPIYHKTYPQELDKARTALSQYSNLYLAGRTGLFWYNNMDHSMENAFQLTKRLLREAGQADASEQSLAAGRARDCSARPAEDAPRLLHGGIQLRGEFWKLGLLRGDLGGQRCAAVRPPGRVGAGVERSAARPQDVDLGAEVGVQAAAALGAEHLPLVAAGEPGDGHAVGHAVGIPLGHVAPQHPHHALADGPLLSIEGPLAQEALLHIARGSVVDAVLLVAPGLRAGLERSLPHQPQLIGEREVALVTPEALGALGTGCGGARSILLAGQGGGDRREAVGAGLCVPDPGAGVCIAAPEGVSVPLGVRGPASAAQREQEGTDHDLFVATHLHGLR